MHRFNLISCFCALIVSFYYSGARKLLSKSLRCQSGSHLRRSTRLCKSTLQTIPFVPLPIPHRRKICRCVALFGTCSRYGIAAGYLTSCFFIRNACSGRTGQTTGHLTDTHHGGPGDVLLAELVGHLGHLGQQTDRSVFMMNSTSQKGNMPRNFSSWWSLARQRDVIVTHPCTLKRFRGSRGSWCHHLLQWADSGFTHCMKCEWCLWEWRSPCHIPTYHSGLGKDILGCQHEMSLANNYRLVYQQN